MDYDLKVTKTLERVSKNYYYIIRGEEIDMCQALKEIREEEYNRGIEEGLRQAENKSRRRGKEMCRAMKEIREEEYNRGMQEGIEKGLRQAENEDRRQRQEMCRDMKEIREEEYNRGIEEGRRQAEIIILAGLVKDHLLDLKEAAKRAEMSEDDFRKTME